MNYKKGTQTRGCMKSVMRYVSQLGKTLWDGQQLVSGIGCQPETAFDEFLSTKLLHYKDDGVMFYPDAEVTKVTPLIFRNETPTDDEREDMIAFLLRDHNFEESPWGRTYTDAEIANALRRSEVPEPMRAALRAAGGVR